MRTKFFLRYTNIMYLFMGFIFFKELNLMIKAFFNFLIISYKYIKK